MAKKIGCIALITAIIMAVMCISVAAAETFNTKLYYTGYDAANISAQYFTWEEITSFPKDLTDLSGTTTENSLYLLFKTNQIIHDGSIIIITFNLSNLTPDLIEVLGVGQPTSAVLVGNRFLPRDLDNVPLNQNILSVTEREASGNTQVTVAIRAAGYSSEYCFVSVRHLKRANDSYYIKMASCQLYEDIESASSSGTTPDEMREVLDRWSEEELLPGIGNEFGNQLTEKLPEVYVQLEEANIELGNSIIDEFTSTLGEQIAPYMEEAAQIRDAIHEGAGSVFNYLGTDCVITLPAARNPFTGNSLMWPEYQIDLAQYYRRLPASMRQLISVFLTLLISIGIIREVLDVINTLLIHREILTMPDDR